MVFVIPSLLLLFLHIFPTASLARPNPDSIGASNSTPAAGSLVSCLKAGIPANLVATPSDLTYYISEVTTYNLAIAVHPIAVTFPNSTDHVVAAVKCAGQYGAKVQAKSGGHSYMNFGTWIFTFRHNRM